MQDNDIGIRGALQDARELARQERATKIVDTDDEAVFLVPTISGPEVLSWPHSTPERRPAVRTIESFRRYLALFTDIEGPIFPAWVYPHQVIADLAPGHPKIVHQLRLDLENSQPFTALMDAGKWQSQESLAFLLANSLRNSIDRALLLQIATLRAVSTSSKEISISPVGLKNAKKFDSVRVEWFTKDGTQQAEEMVLDWLYEGPILSCWPETVRVPLRLSLQMTSNGGLVLCLKPQDAREIFDSYFVQFTEYLDATCALPHVAFFAASYDKK